MNHYRSNARQQHVQTVCLGGGGPAVTCVRGGGGVDYVTDGGVAGSLHASDSNWGQTESMHMIPHPHVPLSPDRQGRGYVGPAQERVCGEEEGVD